MTIDEMIAAIDTPRFHSKWIPEPFSGCWLWIAGADKLGYGRFGIGRKLHILAHRASFLLRWGYLPKEIDHLCHTPSCVNPDHLESVTHAENCKRGHCGRLTKLRMAAQTHCKRGHSLASAYITPNGARQCTECQRERVKTYRSKQ